MKNIISVLEAQSRILTVIRPGPIERIPVKKSFHRILAEDIISNVDIPAADLSSMDGYAVRSEDIQAASADEPVTLEVVGEILAGQFPEFTIQPGQCTKIMTGASLPLGADTVIPFEEIPKPEDMGQIQVFTPFPLARNIRPRGQDVQKGTRILHDRKKIDAADIGALAMTGHDTVELVCMPSIGIFSTGDELVSPGKSLEAGKIYESNSWMLAALVEKFGGNPVILDKAADDPILIESTLNNFLDKNVDLILSTGGVSVGTHDYVREVVAKSGRIDFWRVNIRPGKPLVFGDYQGIPYFGLPGNPVSSYVSFLVFVLPAINKILGLPPLERKCIKAVLDEDIQSDGRESYLRAGLITKNGIYYAGLTSHQGSGNLFSLVDADALLIIPSGVKSLPAGTEVDAWLLK